MDEEEEEGGKNSKNVELHYSFPKAAILALFFPFCSERCVCVCVSAEMKKTLLVKCYEAFIYGHITYLFRQQNHYYYVQRVSRM